MVGILLNLNGSRLRCARFPSLSHELSREYSRVKPDRFQQLITVSGWTVALWSADIKSSKDADLVTSRSILHRVKVTQRLNVLYSIS